ncbi:MOSC domain-containing protein [Streptomyces sp. NBC_01142]|uniref:MOSC domain-containing protein n=1 Tax=Streptomyces sp. NBC_01142 TaxID=2975865 RepID=UPI00225960CF|nr:MOSC N-terminal beta barrel domain-containing protein [Streptomyces sp. NBC_01142]MCX4822598.1 MOSC domain-containing protein [Streptomyces sp. NBC_01142]
MGITVRTLTYYPVKGCAGTAVQSARVGGTGLEHDRTFMVVDAADGSFRSQRKLPAMAAIRPEMADGGTALRLSAPGIESVRLDVDPDGELRPVSMFGRDIGNGADQGDLAAEWFSQVMGTTSRLVRVPRGFDRDGWGETPGKVGFADAHAVLVVSQASLDGLNARIEAAGGAPVPMDRFRANIVLDGCTEPHAEDEMRRLEIGTVQLAYAVRAMRCGVPMVDQLTGRRAGPEPIRTLAAYRREPAYENKVSFGMKAAVLRPGALSVGDTALPTWADGTAGAEGSNGAGAAGEVAGAGAAGGAAA